MQALKNTLDYFLDFLFPTSRSLHDLLLLSAGELLEILPRARDMQDDSLIVLFDYKDASVRELIWELKYKGNQKVAHIFAVLLVDILRHELIERSVFENFTHPLLIPMPTSDKRRKERGFNQTEILAEEMIKLDPELVFYDRHILEKTVHTESQARTHATKRERVKNLEHSMRVVGSVEGRSIILLDDVTTSGATFREATRALKTGGAKRILCVAVAH